MQVYYLQNNRLNSNRTQIELVTYLRSEARLIKVSSVSELLWEANVRVVELLDVWLSALAASDLFHFDDLNAFASGSVSTGHVSYCGDEWATDGEQMKNRRRESWISSMIIINNHQKIKLLSRQLTAFRNCTLRRHVSVLAVHVVDTRSRVVSQPDAVVLHTLELVRLGDQLDGHDLALRLLHLLQLLEEVPELRFGHHLIRAEQSHAVELRVRIFD